MEGGNQLKTRKKHDPRIRHGNYRKLGRKNDKYFCHNHSHLLKIKKKEFSLSKVLSSNLHVYIKKRQISHLEVNSGINYDTCNGQ